VSALTALVLVAAAAGTAYGLGWVDHWRGLDRPAAKPLPIAAVEAGDATVASPASGGRPVAARVRRALRAPLKDPRLGDHVVARVAGLRGAPVLAHGNGSITPASTLKLLTTAAALHRLGPGWRPTTSATLSGHTLTVVGGGDVLLDDTGLAALASDTAAALRHRHVKRVDLRWSGPYTGPAASPHWPKTYLPEEVVAPIDPLWVDEGHTPGPDGTLGTEDDGRVADPAHDALAAFGHDLSGDGIKVGKVGGEGAAGRIRLATHRGAPLDQTVEHILELSDNEGAETLGHLMGHSFDGGVTATLAALRDLGIDTKGLHLYDNSGLSRDDRVSADALVQVLQHAATDPDLSAIIEGLPVAGWTGSLADRFTGPASAARGTAHAKTGTLTGVSALAGTVTDADGTPLVVAILADGEDDTTAARDALDDAMADLARCHCG